MNEEPMTVKRVLEITRDNLSNIAVPRSLNQSIGIPIDQAISNINACIEAMEKKEEETQEEETDGESDPE